MRPRGTSIRRLMTVIAILGLGFAIVRWSAQGASFADLFYAHVLEHDTVYSKNFTEAKWARLAPGMTAAEVESILGSPITKVYLSRATEIWKYSVSPADTHHWRRDVEFQHLRVREIDSTFYID